MVLATFHPEINPEKVHLFLAKKSHEGHDSTNLGEASIFPGILSLTPHRPDAPLRKCLLARYAVPLGCETSCGASTMSQGVAMKSRKIDPETKTAAVQEGLKGESSAADI
jgi:hypothetical protein